MREDPKKTRMKAWIWPLFTLLLLFADGITATPATAPVQAEVPPYSSLSRMVRPLTPPKEGEPVDIVPWAYEYRAHSTVNPPETQWLDATPGTLCGFLWEERRPVRRIEVEFPPGASPVPDANELSVSTREGYAPVQKQEGGVLKPSGHPETTPRGGMVFAFECPKDINGLKVLYSGTSAETVGAPAVRAFTETARWRAPLNIAIEWGFQGDKPGQRWDGRIEAYNGFIGKIAPLEGAGDVTVTGEHDWRDGASATVRRGIKAEVFLTAGPVNTRTIVTLWTSGGDVSFAAEDLDKGPILIPGVGIYVSVEGSGITARQFQQQLASQHLKTVRQQAREAAEESWASAMKRYHGDKAFPAFPVPPYEPPMKIDVPEKPLVDQWRLGYWHIRRWCQQLDDKTYCISIWPFSKSSWGAEGTTAIGLETSQIIRALDLMGVPDIAQGGLNYWVYGDHAKPRGQFVETTDGSLPLANLFNSPNHRSPGYDQHASGGHGCVLEAAALHSRMPDNNAWLQEVKPILKKACDWTIVQRKAWSKNFPKDAWCYGLEPPADLCDGSDIRLYFATSAWYYAGLKAAASLLAEDGSAGGADLLREAELFRQDIRKGRGRSMRCRRWSKLRTAPIAVMCPSCPICAAWEVRWIPV